MEDQATANKPFVQYRRGGRQCCRLLQQKLICRQWHCPCRRTPELAASSPRLTLELPCCGAQQPRCCQGAAGSSALLFEGSCLPPAHDGERPKPSCSRYALWSSQPPSPHTVEGPAGSDSWVGPANPPAEPEPHQTSWLQPRASTAGWEGSRFCVSIVQLSGLMAKALLAKRERELGCVGASMCFT